MYNISVDSVMDAVSVSNQAGFFKKPNTVTQWDWTMCSVSDIMSVYVCVCDPLTSEPIH